MGHCKDCKCFQPYNEYEYKEGDNDNVGFCSKVKHIDNYASIPDAEEKDTLYSASEWGDDSTIVVGINFGCIHWEKHYTCPSPGKIIDFNNPFDKQKIKEYSDHLSK